MSDRGQMVTNVTVQSHHSTKSVTLNNFVSMRYQILETIVVSIRRNNCKH